MRIRSCDSLSPVQVLPSLTALTDLDVSSNKEAGGVVHSLVSALPLTQMRRLPLNNCSLNAESFTALGQTALLILLQHFTHNQIQIRIYMYH